MTTPSPSPPISLSPPSAGERLARCTAPPAHSPPLPPSSGRLTRIQTLRIASTHALINAVTAAIPPPPLPPLPPSLSIPHRLTGRDDIARVSSSSRKRFYVSTIRLQICNLKSSRSRPARRSRDRLWVCQHSQHKGRRACRAPLAGYTRLVSHTRGCSGSAALTWWNGQIRTLGPEAYAMTWEVLKKKMTDKYCPQGEIKKLEIELWNLKVKGNDYLSGLPDNIYGNVKAAKPKTLDETIELANDLMDRKLLTYAERQSDNKRRADDSSRNNHGHQQQPFKRQNVAKVYNMGTGERKPYGGSLPKCNKCHLHHNGPCTQRCHKCNKIGHFARDCRNTGNTNVANTQKGNGATPKGNGCFECGAPGHFRRVINGF
ncbi:putative reverse transcriptase domain-containing protein [Tanacetum coccineum]